VQAKSSATDPFAEADRAVETLLVKHLSAAGPDDGLLGEDGAQRVCQPVVRALRTRTWSGSSPPVLACCRSCWWRPASRPTGCARW